MVSKKILTLVFFLFFCANVAYANAVSVKKQKFVATSRKFYYSIIIMYPQFHSRQYRQSVQTLNKMIYQQIVAQMKQFKQNVESSMRWVFEGRNSSLPMPKLDEKSNSLVIKYDVFYNAKGIVSLRFNRNVYFYRAAHPNTTTFSLNFDLTTNKSLDLEDLFKPKTNYLKILSSITRKDLMKTLADSKSRFNEIDDPRISILQHGTKPLAKNFATWNLTAKNLFITFDPYAVAAYADGPQYVTIPYQSIIKVLNPEIIGRILRKN